MASSVAAGVGDDTEPPPIAAATAMASDSLIGFCCALSDSSCFSLSAAAAAAASFSTFLWAFASFDASASPLPSRVTTSGSQS